MRRAAQSLGMQLSIDDAESLLEALDTDGDGRVDLNEFTAMMRRARKADRALRERWEQRLQQSSEGQRLLEKRQRQRLGLGLGGCRVDLEVDGVVYQLQLPYGVQREGEGKGKEKKRGKEEKEGEEAEGEGGTLLWEVLRGREGDGFVEIVDKVE